MISVTNILFHWNFYALIRFLTSITVCHTYINTLVYVLFFAFDLCDWKYRFHCDNNLKHIDHPGITYDSYEICFSHHMHLVVCMFFCIVIHSMELFCQFVHTVDINGNIIFVCDFMNIIFGYFVKKHGVSFF